MRRMMGAVAAMLVAGGASANTVTFQGGTYVGGEAPFGTYVEDGITVTPDQETYTVTGRLDDGGTSTPRFYTLTMEKDFAARSLDLLSLPDFNPRLCSDETGTCIPFPYENVELSGYLDGVQVAYDAFNMYDVADPSTVGTYVFGERFDRIDSLVIGFTPFSSLTYPGLTLACGFPCSSYEVDNITLVPVPLPASGVLLAGAVAAAGVARRRRG